MTTLNSYANLADFKAFKTARGQTSTTDATDDAIVELLLKAASRYIDTQTAREYFPYIQTRYFDVPINEIDPRTLKLDADLLEVISVVNGDGTTIPSTEYALRPRNASPYIYIRLVDNSTYYWASDGAGDTHDVIAITGIWGFHNRYASAWLIGSTLAEDLETSETSIDVASGTLFAVGDLIRFGNELGYLSAKATNTLTSTRAENGSTAATHLTSANVYIWQVMDELKNVVLEITTQAYNRRFGQGSNAAATVTAAGVVLSPKDIPAMATDFIHTYRRYS